MPTDAPEDVTSLAEKARETERRLKSVEDYLGSTPIPISRTLEQRLTALEGLEKRIKTIENKVGLNPRA